MAFPPVLAAGQSSQVRIGGPDVAESMLLFHTDALQIEAPNWSLDGKTLYLNGNGMLGRLTSPTPMVCDRCTSMTSRR